MKRAVPSCSRSDGHDCEDSEDGREVATKTAKYDEAESDELESDRIYYTKIDFLPHQFNSFSFSLSELLEKIRPICSLHFNFMIDLEWLIEQYPKPFRALPIVLVVGEKLGTTRKELVNNITANGMANISVATARLPIPFGVHHSKLSLFQDSDDYIHVIVSTANLIEGDWRAKTQQFYYTKGKILNEQVQKRTAFSNDLETYLKGYNLHEIEYWISRLAFVQFPECTTRLVFSLPGYHKAPFKEKVGHLAIRNALNERNKTDGDLSKLMVCQSSSIGSLGPKPSSWFTSQFLSSLRGDGDCSQTRLYVIYPTLNQVIDSFEGVAAGGSLPYQQNTHSKQEWLREKMCKWKSDQMGRSQAMPHVKAYTQINSSRTVDWQILSSANLSKAAWGEEQKEKTQLMVRSYEVGVLILDPLRVRLPFDYPICFYNKQDRPWTIDN